MKTSLTANWMRNEPATVPEPLKEPLVEWRQKRSSKPYSYQSALLGIDTPCQHWAHIIYCEADKTGLVTWTGKGILTGAVVVVSGPLEAIKRKIEKYEIASFRASKPFKTGHKRIKSAQKPIKTGHNSPPKLLSPPSPTSRAED